MTRRATILALLCSIAAAPAAAHEDPQFMPRERRTIYPSAAQNPRNAWLQPPCEPPDRRTPAWK